MLDLKNIKPVASYAIFVNQFDDILITYKAASDSDYCQKCQMILLAANDENTLLLLKTEKTTLLLGETPHIYAEQILNKGKAAIFCAATNTQSLDYNVPMAKDKKLTPTPIKSAKNDKEIGDFLSNFMASGARSIIATGAELE